MTVQVSIKLTQKGAGAKRLNLHLTFANQKVDAICALMAKLSLQPTLSMQEKQQLKTLRPLSQKWAQRKIRLQRRIDKARLIANPTKLSRSSFKQAAMAKRDPATVIADILNNLRNDTIN